MLRDRFGGELGDDMKRFSSSVPVDLEMADEDLDASVAHAEMLARTGIVSPDEGETIVEGLETIRRELAEGSFRPDEDDDDIHMAVERRLVELVGEAGRKLHTARSRNDQVATDVRLWLKRHLGELDETLGEVVSALLHRCGEDGKTLMPGYTHLQRGQPILLGHHLLAHAWAASRDRERVRACRERLDLCPLGAGAMAGTSHPIDREWTAERLGFRGPVPNAMDAVAARDHEQEAVALCAIAATSLSRQAEEIVLWSSREFDFVRVGEGYATGSSIMPQKRNPDAAELVRAKAALVHGDLVACLGILRGLPMAYDRDLQETRRPLFHAVRTVVDSARITARMWRTLTVRRDRFSGELSEDPALATELADWLAESGVPFREAHGLVAGLVRWCEERDRSLVDLTAEERGRFHPLLADEEAARRLDPAEAVARRRSLGGTAWSEIERQMEMLGGMVG